MWIDKAKTFIFLVEYTPFLYIYQSVLWLLNKNPASELKGAKDQKLCFH